MAAASVTSLTVELFENILVHALAGENPSGQPIASLSQTCWYCHNVIYHPDNSHLWYSLCLVVWDDPIRAAEWRSHRVPENITESGIDWKEVFIRRMDARRTFGALSSQARRVTRKETIKALRSVLAVLSTTSPGGFRDGDQWSRSLTAIWSPFSTFFTTSQSSNLELSLAGGSLPSKFAAHLHPVSLQISNLSKNSGWVSSIVLSKLNGVSTSGKGSFYPHRPLSDHILSPIPLPESTWFWNILKTAEKKEKEMEAQLFSQLIFLMGSGPISTSYPLDDATEPGTPQSDLAAEVDHQRLMPLKSDYGRALQRARARVYDMSYLREERSWGPFQIHDAYDLNKVGIMEWIGRWDQRILREQNRMVTEHIVNCRGWIPTTVRHYWSVRPYVEGLFKEVVGVGEPVKPGPHQYKPDFTYLAACRIVIEAGLRQRAGVGGSVPPVAGIGIEQGAVLTTPDDGETIKLAEDAGGEDQQISLALEMLRLGSAPGYRGIVLARGKDAVGGLADSLSVDEHLGKGKRKETGGKDGVDGWDWAGVEGEWRRVIGIPHYRTLLRLNVRPPHPDHDSSWDLMDETETLQMISMKLKITHYSSPPARPSSKIPSSSELAYRLPVIHFEEPPYTPLHALRSRVRGCVRMCEGGWVRWSLNLFSDDYRSVKELSENIQVGDVGSAMGFIGFWSGANHDGIDSLGPSWAWKIS